MRNAVHADWFKISENSNRDLDFGLTDHHRAQAVSRVSDFDRPHSILARLMINAG